MSITLQKIFSRLLIVVLGIVAVFTVGNKDNIKLELKNEVTTKTEIIEITVLNYTGKTLTTGEEISVEKNENGEWVKMDFAEDYVINELAIVIRNLKSANFKINVVDAFGKTLDEGEYRLTKSFGEGISACAVFTVRAG